MSGTYVVAGNNAHRTIILASLPPVALSVKDLERFVLAKR